MMGPATHFLFGMLCGAAVAGVALVVRRRWAVYVPVLVLGCGFWAVMPCVLGVPDATHGLANLFFGYAWLHAGLRGREALAFFLVVALANLLLLGYVVFLARFFSTVAMVRWEREDRPRGSTRSKRRRSHRGRAARG